MERGPAIDVEFDRLIAFVEGETWKGFNFVREDTPTSNLSRIIFQVRAGFSEDSPALVTLDSTDTSQIEITAASTWTGTVKPQVFQLDSDASDLAAGEYVWSLWVQTAAGHSYTWARGVLHGDPPFTLVPA